MQFEAKCKRSIFSKNSTLLNTAKDEKSLKKVLDSPHHCYFTEGEYYTFKVGEHVWESVNNFSDWHLFNVSRDFDLVADHFELKTLSKIK
ncbi:hypothetical protein GCM10010954_30290 [Halobacillus andaensis]|uniref:Uncharacterized protein n=1 Tax=Halobacillus andaensis TaxID=1176239 RepID=A0A917EXM2_HALAA|nr:hypothetical protein [Halobacillus andaensis]MBP2005134.1 hypothetical protein [Halobacillus andaensis]GGF29110.1 hypothetical protein GCM10010954_30290 [Halobacillus andaensis]